MTHLPVRSFLINWPLVSLAHSAHHAQKIPALFALKIEQEPHVVSYFSNMQAELVLFHLGIFDAHCILVPLVDYAMYCRYLLQAP
jgi:hypothetical protein